MHSFLFPRDIIIKGWHTCIQFCTSPSGSTRYWERDLSNSQFPVTSSVYPAHIYGSAIKEISAMGLWQREKVLLGNPNRRNLTRSLHHTLLLLQPAKISCSKITFFFTSFYGCSLLHHSSFFYSFMGYHVEGITSPILLLYIFFFVTVTHFV